MTSFQFRVALVATLAFGMLLVAGVRAQVVLKTFVNSKAGLAGKRADHYADFSFDYPADWKLSRETGDQNPNFVTAERSVKTADVENTLEQLNVGYFYDEGYASQIILGQQIAEAKKRLWDQMIAKMKNGYPDSKLTSEGPVKVAGLSGYELRFEGRVPKVEEVKLWRRQIVIPNPDAGQNGVILSMVGTSMAPELKEERDLGEKGQLPIILSSFKLGKHAAK